MPGIVVADGVVLNKTVHIYWADTRNEETSKCYERKKQGEKGPFHLICWPGTPAFLRGCD